jgi:hypothetical protein
MFKHLDRRGALVHTHTRPDPIAIQAQTQTFVQSSNVQAKRGTAGVRTSAVLFSLVQKITVTKVTDNSAARVAAMPLPILCYGENEMRRTRTKIEVSEALITLIVKIQANNDEELTKRIQGFKEEIAKHGDIVAEEEGTVN